MEIGMLWFDNDKQNDLIIKINQAASYYHKKYGQKPNLCYVHPCMISELDHHSRNSQDKAISPLIEVKESIEILPNHFWIGFNQKEI
jgi:hypothetical protein